MEISLLIKNEYIKKLLSKPFDKYEPDDVITIDDNINFYEYSKIFKIIRFNGTFGSFPYYVFPKKDFDNLLITLMNI